jgi:hypothetical protein
VGLVQGQKLKIYFPSFLLVLFGIARAQQAHQHHLKKQQHTTCTPTGWIEKSVLLTENPLKSR